MTAGDWLAVSLLVAIVVLVIANGLKRNNRDDNDTWDK